MSNIEITFENPLFLLLLIPAFIIILFPFLMLPKNRRKSVKKIAPVVIHMVICLLLVFIFAGISFVENSDEQAVVLLVDLSSSTKNVRDQIVDRTNDLLTLIDKKVPVGIVAFSGECLYSLTFEESKRTFEPEFIKDNATNLEEALVYAESIAPKDKATRFIVLSDGKENEGNADAMAYYLSGQGIRIDAMYFDTTSISTPEVQITSISGINSSYLGDEIEYVVDVKSNVDTEITLNFFDTQGKGSSIITSVKKGSNLISVKVTPSESGIQTYCAKIETANDTRKENNTAYTCISVASAPKVLIVADETYRMIALKQLLSLSYEVETVSSFDAPDTISKMCKYDQIILSNARYYALPIGFDQLLDTYVSIYGRSLIAVGGDSTFMYGNMEGSTIEKMLPVDLALNESTDSKSVALMLVLDVSSSMKGDNITVAKQGAINCLDAMTDNDFVGVVSFSSDANVDSELLVANEDNKETLKRVISSLKLGSGTSYKNAFVLAKNELEKSNADVKHIMFLSDGQPTDGGYDEVVAEASEKGITVSTIGLGFSSTILEYLASLGKGRYYIASGADDLPEIMLSETEKAKVNSYIVGDFIPKISETGDVTEGVTSTLPMLKGYLGTTLKEKATAYILSEKDHPIYSSWEYGLGTVSCFTSDLMGVWSEEWFKSEIGMLLINRMVSTTIDRTPERSALNVTTTVNGSTVDITVNTYEKTLDSLFSAKVQFGESVKELELQQLYEGTYKGTFEIEGEGAYLLTLYQTNQRNTVIDEYYGAVGVSYSKEYDAFVTGGEVLLGKICAYGGGMVHDDVLSAAKVELPPIKILYDPVVPFAIICLVIFVTDIAIRKLKWSDVKKYFIKK